MTRPESSRQLDDLKQKDVEKKYPAGTEVVVNIKSEWQAVSLAKPASLENGKIKIELASGDIIYQQEQPDIVSFKDGDVIHDPDHGDFTLRKKFITENGSIEFDILEPSGEIANGVSQEFLKSWDKTTKLEVEVGNLLVELKKLSRTKRAELKPHVDRLKEISSEVMSNLPESVGDFAVQSEKDITVAVGKIKALHTEAEKLIETLSSMIVEAKNSPEETARQKPAVHKKTTVEAETKEQELKEKAENHDAQAKLILAELQRYITEHFQDKCDELLEMKKEEGRLLLNPPDPANRNEPEFIRRFPNARRRGNRGAPGAPDAELIVLKNEDKEEAKKAVRKDYFLSLIEHNKDIEDELVKRRKKRAKIEPRADFVENGDYKDVHKERVNLELIDGIVADWQKPYEHKDEEELSPDKNVFDFEKETADLKKQFADLIALLPKDEAGAVKNEFVSLNANILKYLNGDFATLEKGLSSLKNAKENRIVHNGSRRIISSDKRLREQRVEFIKFADHQLDDFLRELTKIKIKSEATEKFVKTEEASPVDLDAYSIERILQLDQAKFKSALEKMFEGNAEKEFKDLMPKVQGIMSPAELKRCGIKNWDAFKNLWDSKLAGEVAKSMEEMAKQSLQKKIAEAITAMDQIKAFKGQIALRASLNALLVGGSSLGLRALIGDAHQLLQTAAVVAGGAGTGAIKWWTFKAVMGEKSNWTKKNKETLKNAGDAKAPDIINKLVAEMMGSVNSGQAPQQGKKGFWSKLNPANWFGKITNEHRNILDGMPMISNLMAQTIREATAGELKVAEGVVLKGAARLRYERALAHLEVKDVDEQKKVQLAQVFAEMNNRGAEIQSATAGNKQTSNIIEKFVHYYSGKGSIGGSMVTNAALAGAFAASGTVRAIFGGAMGAYGGWKLAEMKTLKWEAEEGKANVAEKMKNVNWFTKNYPTLTPDQRKHYKEDLLYLKRYLHGKASKQDLTAAVKITPEGPLLDTALLTQIDSMVYEAEKTGILMENKEDEMKLEKVLETMREFQNKSTLQDEKGKLERFSKWARRTGIKTGGAIVGAAAGAGAYYLGGFLVHKAVVGIRGWFGIESPKEVALGSHLENLEHGQTGTGHEEVVSASGVHNESNFENYRTDHEINPINLNVGVENFAVEHHLSQDTYDQMKELVTAHPELNNSQSLQRIYEASVIGKGVHSHSDFIKGGIDTLEEGGGERRLVIFEEIRKHEGADAAAKYLEEQNFSKKHLSYLSEFVKKGSHAEFVKFAEGYNPQDKDMVSGLFKACRGKETTDLFRAGLENGEDRSIGLRSGKVSYFGVEDKEPVLSGNGKVVVTETHATAKVHQNPLEVMRESGKVSHDHSIESPSNIYPESETGKFADVHATGDYTINPFEGQQTGEAATASTATVVENARPRVVQTFDVSESDAIKADKFNLSRVENLFPRGPAINISEDTDPAVLQIKNESGQPMAIHYSDANDGFKEIREMFNKDIEQWHDAFSRDLSEDKMYFGDKILLKISTLRQIDAEFDARVQELDYAVLTPEDKFKKLMEVYMERPQHPALTAEDRLFLGGEYIDSDNFVKVRAEWKGEIYENAYVATGDGSRAMRIEHDDGSIEYVSERDQRFLEQNNRLAIETIR